MDQSKLKEGPVSVTVKTDTGKKAEGRGQVALPSGGARMKKALPFGIGGLLCLIVTVAPPGPHSIITGPLGVILVAVAAYLFRISAKLEKVEVTCPGCGKDVVLDGGPLKDQMDDQCPSCNRALQVVPHLEA